jgi:hypothetical protein
MDERARKKRLPAQLLSFRKGAQLTAAVLHVRWVKNGTPSTHPIQGDELRALRRLQRENPTSPFVFVSERARRSPRLFRRDDRSEARAPRRCGDFPTLPGISRPTPRA